MQSIKMLANFVEEICPKVHKARRKCIGQVIESCLNTEELMVTKLGRGISSLSLEKHRIKQADRLLSNKYLHEEVKEIYSQLTSTIIGDNKEIVILIDWSNLDKNQRHFLLRASLAVEGRSLTIYEEVHTNDTKEKLSTHKEFLLQLKKILPQGVLPVIVTDAGFKITWFKAVEKLGWHWIGRIRGRMKVSLNSDKSWIDGRLLHEQARPEQAKDFSQVTIGKKNNLLCNMVLYKNNPKGRIMKGKLGKRRTWVTAQKCEKAAREPWLLATSLNYNNPYSIVKMYSLRMQIEESFRDLKSSTYGIGLLDSRTYKSKRLQVLVLIASIANTFSWLLGKAAKIQKVCIHFQANTIKNKNVLSNVFLGLKIFKQHRIIIYAKNFINALNFIHLEACCVRCRT